MATVIEVIDVDASPREAFDLIADFSRTAEWDPGVRRGEALDADTPEGRVGLGKRFRVHVELGVRAVPFVYTTTAFVDGEHVAHETRRFPFVGRDEVHVHPHGDGSRIVWKASFSVVGIGRVVDPLLAIGFRRVAAKAVAGLRDALSADATAQR